MAPSSNPQQDPLFGAMGLKVLRRMTQTSQQDIADELHVSVDTVRAWECGKRNMNFLITRCLLAIYKINLEDLKKEVGSAELPAQDDKTETKPKAKKVSDVATVAQELMPIRKFKAMYDELLVQTHQKELARCQPGDVKFIDLFAGIGGIRRAFEANGAKCVFSSEIDTNAQYTYYANYGAVPFGDITKIEVDQIPDHDILCAGFPCQPFSHIGRREGFKHPTQGTMFYEIVRILKAKQPRMIFLENVPGLVNHDNGNTLKVIIESLEDIGYTVKKTVLNAEDFGVPQSRARFYLVGTLNDPKADGSFTFPIPPNVHVDIGDYLESDVSGYSISEHLQKSYLFKKDDGRPKLIDKNSKGPVKTLVSSYHKIQRLTGTFVKDGETGIRLLTAKECKIIMGFPEDFLIPVSRTQMYRQMGNSVVVKVIDAIAKNVMDTFKKTYK